MPFGDSFGNTFPAFTPVSTHQKIRLEVSIFMVVQSDIDRICIVEIGANVVNKSGFWHARETAHFYLSPPVTTVLGDLNQSIIGARIQKSLCNWALRQRGDGVVVGHGIHIPGRIPAPGLIHERHQHAIFIAGQVGRNRCPGIPAIL